MEKYSIEDVEMIIDNEGLWYAIESYMSGKHIKDKKLSEIWDDTDKFLKETRKKIMDYIEKKGKNNE